MCHLHIGGVHLTRQRRGVKSNKNLNIILILHCRFLLFISIIRFGKGSSCGRVNTLSWRWFEGKRTVQKLFVFHLSYSTWILHANCRILGKIHRLPPNRIQFPLPADPSTKEWIFPIILGNKSISMHLDIQSELIIPQIPSVNRFQVCFQICYLLDLILYCLLGFCAISCTSSSSSTCSLSSCPLKLEVIQCLLSRDGHCRILPREQVPMLTSLKMHPFPQCVFRGISLGPPGNICMTMILFV
mmetsp:Transcript_1105/g.1712  ORF Transcript_1105/g.1712 Transcript_1105/m.1712 type:complete len:243 (-) Transcript_1105:1616-2344(-)